MYRLGSIMYSQWDLRRCYRTVQLTRINCESMLPPAASMQDRFLPHDALISRAVCYGYSVFFIILRRCHAYDPWFFWFACHGIGLGPDLLFIGFFVLVSPLFLPARRYASAGYRDRNVSVRLSVCLSVCLSVTRRGIVSKRRKLAAWFFHHLVAPRL